MNKNIEKIYFDMDGVLADFKRGVVEMCHCSPDDDELMWERVKACDKFFLRLKPIEGSVELIKELIDEYGDKVEILTAVPKPSRDLPIVGTEKREWINQWVSEDIKVNTVLRSEKTGFCQGSGCVLVDDRIENIESWQAAGGTGILFTTADEVKGVIANA